MLVNNEIPELRIQKFKQGERVLVFCVRHHSKSGGNKKGIPIVYGSDQKIRRREEK